MANERQRILTMLAEGKITVDEAERLLAALGASEPHPAEPSPRAVEVRPTSRPKYLYIQVDDAGGGSKVNIRVPLDLLRAGVKLSSLLPERARQALSGKGIDLETKGKQAVEAIIDVLSELSVDVEDGGEKVRIYCE